MSVVIEKENGANIGVWLELTKLCCMSAMVESITECSKEYQSLCEFRTETTSHNNSVKRGNFFVIRTLDKVDLAGWVTFLPGTTFLHINRAMICINVSIFFTSF